MVDTAAAAAGLTRLAPDDGQRGHEDEGGLTKPYAFCVLEEGHAGDDALAADLKAWVKDRLAPHKYPRWFDWRESLPKNDRGKVARKVLKAELAEARPSSGANTP